MDIPKRFGVAGMAVSIAVMLVVGCAYEETERPSVPEEAELPGVLEEVKRPGMPTIRLVVDAMENGKVHYHVQSDIPVEHDTFVLVRRRSALFDDRGNVDPKWESYFLVLLAGHTQSESFIAGGWWVAITLPPPHERANVLPQTVNYRDNDGINQKKQIRDERQFNEYHVGHPGTIDMKEYTERPNMPTIRLFVFAVEKKAGGNVTEVSYNVKSDRPVERDTFVLVRERLGFEHDGTEIWKSYFVVLLAGRTQSQNFSEVTWWRAITLPPPHERANELPEIVNYRDKNGINREKQFRDERQFNEYQVGHPDTIDMEEYVGRK